MLLKFGHQFRKHLIYIYIYIYIYITFTGKQNKIIVCKFYFCPLRMGLILGMLLRLLSLNPYFSKHKHLSFDRIRSRTILKDIEAFKGALHLRPSKPFNEEDFDKLISLPVSKRFSRKP